MARFFAMPYLEQAMDLAFNFECCSRSGVKVYMKASNVHLQLHLHLWALDEIVNCLSHLVSSCGSWGHKHGQVYDSDT